MEPTGRRPAAPAKQLGSHTCSSADAQQLSTLLDPNEFSCYFFIYSEENHTVFTELIKKGLLFPSQNVLLSTGTGGQYNSALQISKPNYSVW